MIVCDIEEDMMRSMKKITLALILLLCGMSYAAYAQMTDEQVVTYVKSAAAAGKSQDAITRELLARGVTAEQAERIRGKEGKKIFGIRLQIQKNYLPLHPLSAMKVQAMVR